MNDEMIFNNLLSTLKNYDIYDFISRVSSLNLIPNNQNKCLIFDTIVDTIIRKDKSLFTGISKMSRAKFENIINECMKLSLSYRIDPIEEPFIYRIQFYGDKWILSGITKNIGYSLQLFLDIIFKRKNDFHDHFVSECGEMATLIMELSNNIVDALGYGLSTLEHIEDTNIKYPISNDEYVKLMNSLCVENKIFNLIRINNIENYISVFKKEDRAVDLSEVNYGFYYKPFLKVDDQTSIILNPTMLAPFLIHYFLMKAKEYNIFDQLIETYNNMCFNYCRDYLAKLDHKKIKEDAYGIQLINRSDYKELVLNASNDGILFLRFFCDDGNNFKLNNLFSESIINPVEIEERLSYITTSITAVPNVNRIYQITVFNTFGRALNVWFNTRPYIKNISLSPFDLYCVSVNERTHNNFIMRYLESKKMLLQDHIPFLNDINYISLYTHNNYSFYLSDETDVRIAMLMIDFGDSIDYIYKMLKTEDKQLALFPNGEYLEEIVLNDSERNIYRNLSNDNFRLMNRFKNIDLWITTDKPTSKEMFDVIYTILDTISYWLSELKEYIENNVYIYSSIEIKNKLMGDINDYYQVKDKICQDIDELLKIESLNNAIVINWAPEAYLKFSNETNNQEKKLIYAILKHLFAFSKSVISIEKLDYIFENPLKKKVYSLDYVNSPYFKPTNSKQRLIPVECEDALLYEIGDYFINEKNIKKGTEIHETEKNSICNDTVFYLFKKLCNSVKQYKAEQLIRLLCSDLETTMFSLMLERNRYSYQLNCYPEKSVELQRSFNEINKSSVSQKFLLEYVAAQPPHGDKNIGEMDYEELLSICSVIIDWANISDYFKYKMINSSITMLHSGRIGIDKTDIDKLFIIRSQTAVKHIGDNSNPYIDTYHADIVSIQPPEELDVAFYEEFGYTFKDFIICVFAMIEVGNEINNDVKSYYQTELISKVSSIIGRDDEVVQIIIDDLSLSEREDYLVPPEKFNNNDIWPWRFNRRLSVTRRPVVKFHDKYIWGNRQLYHCLFYTIDLINNAKFRVFNKKGKLSSLLGKIANYGGNHFNDAVANKLKEIKGLIIDSKVKKINGIKITDDENQTIGDIDVLIINPRTRKIIVAEVKDFSFTKTPFEMHQEYLQVFCDQKDKLCYISKHKRRVEWIKMHLEDIIKQYNLDNCNWKIDDILILNESIISNEYYHINQKTVLYTDLTKEVINKI